MVTIDIVDLLYPDSSFSLSVSGSDQNIRIRKLELSKARATYAEGAILFTPPLFLFFLNISVSRSL